MIKQNDLHTLGIIDAADLKQHNGVNIISEWALLALDVNLKEDGIERRFILV